MIKVTNTTKGVLSFNGRALKPGASTVLTEAVWEYYQFAPNTAAWVKSGSLKVEETKANEAKIAEVKE